MSESAREISTIILRRVDREMRDKALMKAQARGFQTLASYLQTKLAELANSDE